MKALAERLTSRVNVNGPVVRPELGPCSLWTGAVNRQGYGVLRVAEAGKVSTQLAHRVAFFLARGRWPEPFALHRCDTPACVRNDHLFEGTARTNTDDMMSKGRNRTRAHELVGERNGNAKLSDDERAALRAQRAQGVTFAALGRAFGITKQAAMYVVKKGRRTP